MVHRHYLLSVIIISYSVLYVNTFSKKNTEKIIFFYLSERGILFSGCRALVDGLLIPYSPSMRCTFRLLLQDSAAWLRVVCCCRYPLNSPGSHLCVTTQRGNTLPALVIDDLLLRSTVTPIALGCVTAATILPATLNAAGLLVTNDLTVLFTIASNIVTTRAFYPGFLYVAIKFSISYHPEVFYFHHSLLPDYKTVLIIASRIVSHR